MTVQQQIQARIAAFTVELEELVRRAAIESVTSALSETAPRGARSSAHGTAAATAPTAPVGANAGKARRKGAKRDPKEIDALTERVGAWIKASPGKRIEEIGSALQTSTSELALPITRLLSSKAIKKTGVKRATKYFPR